MWLLWYLICSFQHTFIPFVSFRSVSFRKIKGAFHYAKDSGNFCRNSNGIERSVSVFSDRNIRDHLWRWSTHFGRNIPTEIRRSIFAKPFLCPYYGIRKKNLKWQERFLLVGPVKSVNVLPFFSGILTDLWPVSLASCKAPTVNPIQTSWYCRAELKWIWRGSGMTKERQWFQKSKLIQSCRWSEEVLQAMISVWHGKSYSSRRADLL